MAAPLERAQQGLEDMWGQHPLSQAQFGQSTQPDDEPEEPPKRKGVFDAVKDDVFEMLGVE